MNPERLGPYRLDRLLGRGGMGAVFAAVEEPSGRRAAVKVIAAAFVEDSSFRERFAAEIESLKRLEHPNIVRLYGYGEQEGLLFYAMELVDGPTLQQELARGRRFTWREACRIGVQIAQALKHAHDRGVIHRDLKPANLVLADEEQVKLLDFGIAKLFGGAPLTVTGGLLGTIDYMAPEQAEGGRVTAKSDLYSLGAVLFALLTGRPPLAGGGPPDVLRRLSSEPPPPLRALAPTAPEELERIVAQLLEKDPARRIPTALAVANRLRAMEHALSAMGEPREGTDEENSEAGLSGTVQPLGVTERDRAERLPDTLAAAPTQPGDGIDDSAAPGAWSYAGPALEDAGGDTGAAAASRFTTVEEEAQRRRAAEGKRGGDVWTESWVKLGAGVVLVVLLSVVGWRVSRPPTADQLYERIAAARAEDNPQALEAIADQAAQFLARFPDDPRREEVEAVQDEIQVLELERRLAARARRAAGPAATPAEDALLEAMRLEREEPEAAAAKYEAIVALFGAEPGGDEEARVVEIARRRLARLHAAMDQERARHERLVARALERAERLAGDDPAEARRQLEALIALYERKPWARAAVTRARQLLKQLPADDQR